MADNLIVVKTIFRADYEASLDFYEKLIPAAQLLMDDYPDWQRTALKVQLRNYSKHCNLNIDFTSIGYSQEGQGPRTQGAERIEKAAKLLPAALGKEHIRRAGLRRMYLIPVEMEFQDLVDLCRSKVLTNTPDFLEGVAPGVSDFYLLLDFPREPGVKRIILTTAKRNHLPPLTQPEIEANYDSKGRVGITTGETFAQYPEHGLFVDCDYSRLKFDAQELCAFLDAAEQEHDRILENIQSFFFGV